MVKIAIDNSKCDKMVSSIRFRLNRTITAYAKTHQGQSKEFKDQQEVLFGKFDGYIAAKEPRQISFDYAILLKKVRDTNRENNRVEMPYDFETGHPMTKQLIQMQKDLLPSVNTANIKIEYEIEAMVAHEAYFSSGQDVPSVKMPLYITLDPKGPFDMGRDGHNASEDKRQIEQAIAASQASHHEYLNQRSNLEEEYKGEPNKPKGGSGTAG